MFNETAKSILPFVTEKMVHYSRIVTINYFGWTILNLSFYCVFLHFGFAGRLRDWTEKYTKNLFLQVLLFSVVFDLINRVIFFPVSYLTDFWINHDFGVSAQSFADWMFLYCKSIALTLSIEVPLTFLFFYLSRRYQRTWPYLVFAVSILITLFFAFVRPILIEPIFNKYELMKPSPLREEIQALASKAGIANAPLYVVDRHEINAQVAGIGASARIIICDTTLEQMPKEQILCMVSHELGHYALNHILIRCLIGLGISLICLFINLFIAPWFFSNCPPNWEIRGLQDIAAIPLFILLSALGSFYSTPMYNYVARMGEQQADIYGLNLHRDPVNFACSVATSYNGILYDPNPPPILHFWLDSHPSVSERINFAVSSASQN